MKREASPGEGRARADVISGAIIDRVVSGMNIRDQVSAMISVRTTSGKVHEIRILDSIRGEQ
jgi:hypothetical protein